MTIVTHNTYKAQLYSQSWGDRGRQTPEFEAGLFYRVSSRSASFTELTVYHSFELVILVK